MTGLPYLTPLAFGLRVPKNPSMNVAGVVEAVRKNVSRFEPGDEVFGIGKGSYADYALAREEKLAPRPASLTFEQAAVVAISDLTALQGLRDHGRHEPNQKVLIIGASGGVGTRSVQIARAHGAHVTGVCSTAKVELVPQGATSSYRRPSQRYRVSLLGKWWTLLLCFASPRWRVGAQPQGYVDGLHRIPHQADQLVA